MLVTLTFYLIGPLSVRSAKSRGDSFGLEHWERAQSPARYGEGRQNGGVKLGEPKRAVWPDDLGFVAWVRSRGLGNLGHVAMAAFLGFIVSLDGGVLFGSLWAFGLLVVATPVQYWRCRRANS